MKDWTRDLALAAAAGMFIGVIGPFGSYFNGPAGPRIAYWTASVMLGAVIYGVTLRLGRVAAARWRWSGWAGFALGSVLGSGPMALVSRTIATHIWPFLGEAVAPWDWWLQCLVLGLPLAGAYKLTHSHLEGRQRTPKPPTRLSREVICLQMEDHYVRAHTAKGSELILMTLSEAMAGTRQPGLQVHRSWWVARDAVTQVIPEGRGLRLKLLNGLEVPVARRAVARLKAAGLAGS